MMSGRQRMVVAVGLLIVLRLVVGAFLPLSADEAYYWLWSRHLAAGYFDHPPAIAFIIRFGTALLGNTALGVRLGAILLSIPASWLVWRSAVLLTGDDRIGGWACLFFNLTLMVAVLTMAATPDAPSILTAAAFLFCLAKLQQTGDGRWWLAAGVAAGLGLLVKYTAFFLGASALAWMLFDARARKWLWSAWPYLGGVLAALVFAPNILWNAEHGWMTFVFQFARIDQGHLTGRFFAEFLGAQLGMATPFIFLLGAIGLARVRRGENTTLLAAMIWPSFLYFLFHSLHNRVQGNWPCYLYPAFAILAADALRLQGTNRFIRFCGVCAAPVAALMLVLIYAQSLFGIFPLGRGDPTARMLGGGIPAIAARIQTLQKSGSPILTTDYETTAWLRFYSPLRVIQTNQIYRYPQAAAPSIAQLNGPLLYVAEQRRDKSATVAEHFASFKPVAEIDRTRNGIVIARYHVYRAEGLRGAAFGKMP
jgi:4-amino-4-deoxy-L-arabinose transferase-like glycosyltransferase